jgi:glutamyl-tRNA reductase
MHILAVGLNYRTAPVEIREKFAISEQQLPDALRQLKRTRSILECVMVGTCNRTEIYAVVDRLPICSRTIIGFMEKWFAVPREELNKHLYIYENHQAIHHLLRVTAGLDSMIIGETQILGQVRDAFLLAQSQKTTGTMFNALFKQAVTMAKRAHFETSIADNPVSVSYAAVELGKRIFGHFQNKTVMIIGAGKMSELTVKNLYAGGAGKVVVVNRTLERAQQLAGKFGGAAFTSEEMIPLLADVDIVISSTGASSLILTADQVRSVMKKRKFRPLFMIDIAVPRDLDPAIGELSNVYLYDIDDLQMIVDNNLAERQKEAGKIEEMIEAEIEAFDQWYKTLGVSPVIKALQKKSNQIHEDTMESMMKKLPDLNEREIKVIRKLTKSIVNQMLRDPVLRIKEMAGDRRGEDAVQMFSQIFALEEMLAEEESAEMQLKDAKSSVVPVKSIDILART